MLRRLVQPSIVFARILLTARHGVSLIVLFNFNLNRSITACSGSNMVSDEGVDDLIGLFRSFAI